MLIDKEIDDLLYAIPSGVEDYLIQEVDLEYIPKERIEKLIYIINHEKEFKFWQVYQAGCLLCYWGINDGFRYVYDLLLNPIFENVRNNKLDGECYEYILGAVQSYLVNKEKSNQIKLIREKVYFCIESIIKMAKIIPFSISSLYYKIESGYTEYLPLIKDYFSYIIKKPKENYWNINDASEILFKYYPKFVSTLLRENNIELKYCNFKQNRWEKFIKEIEEELQEYQKNIYNN